MRKKTLTAFLLFAVYTINAQETVVASGGDASGIRGSSSYSIGQSVYATNSNENISVAQGVQNGYEIMEISNEKDAITSNLQFTVYPNPTADIINLKIENVDQGILFYQLYSLSGQLLSNDKLTENTTSIPMKNLPYGTYFLKVLSNEKTIKTFKIIKN